MTQTKQIFFSLSRKIRKFKYLILIISTITAYASGLIGTFVSDDIELIQNDAFYKNETNPLKSFSRSYWKYDRQQNLYRPIPVFFYWCQYKIFSLFFNPNSIAFQSAFRFFNLLIHIAVVILLYSVLKKIPLPWSVSFSAALIFAVHPIHSEAVIPANGLAELLCALFLISSIFFHFKISENNKFIIPAAFFLIAAFLSKEHAVIILPIIILYDLLHSKKIMSNVHSFSFKKYIPVWSIYALSTALVFIMHKIFLGCFLPDQKNFCPQIDNPLALTTPLLRFISAVKIQGMAILQFIFPINLSNDYSYAQITPCTSLHDPTALISLFLFITIPFFCIKIVPDKKHNILFLSFCFFLSILPAGNFFIPTGTVFAERLQYIPSLFLSAFFAYILFSLRKIFSLSFTICLFTLFLTSLTIRTIIRTFDWKNPETLAVSAVSTAPKSVKTWNNLAVIYIRNNKYPEAMAACSKSLAIYQKNTTAYANRAYAFIAIGDFNAAENDLKEIIKIEKNNFYANFLHGYILIHKGLSKQAKHHWNKMLKKYPNNKILINALNKLNLD